MTPPANRVIEPDMSVSLHTYDGIQLDQYPTKRQRSLTWGRALRNVSTCELTVPSTLLTSGVPDVLPFEHWLSVFSSADELLWTGPIIDPDVGEDTLIINASDPMVYAQYTRVPISQQWSGADPADIAAELIAPMISLHGLKTRVMVRRDPDGDPFDYETTADEKMLNVVLDDLVDKGLRWTVVAGTIVLGPMPRDPVVELSNEHFTEAGIRIKRDGRRTANDVMVQGGGISAQARMPLGGLNLQSLVQVDDVFELTNARRALRQQLRHTGRIRQALVLSPESQLHPNAPVHISELVPSARFPLNAYGLQTLQELDAVKVSRTGPDVSVAVSLENVVDLPELQVLAGGNDEIVVGEVL
ncbi:MAG: hypothetical protein K2Y33_15745 [Mycolicibacterium frederiksbergense]|nr:hypothetical protein [Mycolicibacterium frederiksbergense]